MDRFFASYIVAFFGVALLAFFSPSINIPLSKISQITPYSVGELIHTQCVISDYHKFSGGSISLTVTDDSGSVKTFIPSYVVDDLDFNLSLGQKIEVVGLVELYRGSIELKVDSPQKIWLN